MFKPKKKTTGDQSTFLTTTNGLSKTQQTNMAVVVGEVVCQLQFVERHDLLHPMAPPCGRIGMNVDSRRHRRVCLARHRPARSEFQKY